MFHSNYYEITAGDNYEFGLRLGEIFKLPLQTALSHEQAKIEWGSRVDEAQPYLEPSRYYFPHYIKELEAYARAAEVPLAELWALNMEDELTGGEHCTTVVTNNGELTAHNEDWEHDAADSLCVLKKTIGRLTVLELFYYKTLGGNAISVNSNGWVQAINTLHHKDRQVGVPRNVIARWLSETANPEEDFRRLQKIPRSAGYSHTFINTAGKIFSLECTAKEQIFRPADSPFMHTNHYLSSLKDFEQAPQSATTWDRYKIACESVKPSMDIAETQKLAEAAMNSSTIGRMIIDLKNRAAHIWLKREPCYTLIYEFF